MTESMAAAAAEAVNRYEEDHGPNLWEDVIWDLPGVDRDMTDRIDPWCASDLVAFEDGSVLGYTPSHQRWSVLDCTAAELAAERED